MAEGERGQTYSSQNLAMNMSGLFIEFKRDGTRIKKRDGSYASDHIAGQVKLLSLLEDQGYLVVFAVGFDEARWVINSYLGSG